MKTINAKEVSIIIGAHAASGFAAGSFVTIAKDEPAYSKKVGTDGKVTRAKSNNDAGTVVIRLDQASATNDFLSGLALLDRASDTGVVPILIRDANGTTLIAAESAWVQKVPDSEFSDESLDREWVLDCGPMDMFVGGN